MIEFSVAKSMVRPAPMIPTALLALAAAALIGTATAVVAAVAFGWPENNVVLYNWPSTCSNGPCEAVGAVIVLPNKDDLDVQLLGPAPGVLYDPAGSPSNFVER